MLAGGRLSMAMVDAVPAGQYGRAALESLGLWAGVEGSLAQSENVRAALALVATGETPLGIVYASDAVAEAGVTVIGTFPADSHPPIRFPVALLTGRRRRRTGPSCRPCRNRRRMRSLPRRALPCCPEPPALTPPARDA